MILRGKKTEKEKYNFYFFDNINKLKDYNYYKGINGGIFKSLFDSNRIVLIIKIDTDYFKKNKQTFEQIQEKIKNFLKSCSSEYKNIDTYIHIENKIINMNASYDLFIQELKDKKIIDENIKVNIEPNKIMDKKLEKEKVEIDKDSKIKISNEKVNNNVPNKNNENKKNEIKLPDKNNIVQANELEQLKLQLRKEKEKIKELEKLLLEEKNKNKKSETMINDLRKDLEKERNNNNKIKKEIKEEKINIKKLGKETKESMIETIIEKDKEIKELKEKLARFPFILEEGEDLLSIRFISTDQQLNYSIICKNTDEFHKIEGKLYKEFPKYSENENYFLLNGKKINRYKTLEQNGVKNGDTIMLNEISIE